MNQLIRLLDISVKIKFILLQDEHIVKNLTFWHFRNGDHEKVG